MSGDNFLKEIGRSYIVSAFLPAALFVSLLVLLYRGFLPRSVAILFAKNNSIKGGDWVLLFFIILWVAFYLFSASVRTVKIFEGYLLPAWLQEMMTDRLKKKWPDYIHWYKKYKKLDKKIGIGQSKARDIQNFKKYWRYAFEELQNLDQIGPFDPDNLLPTRLGNVLRSSEIYAFERYWVEELTVWPRLYNIFPPIYVKTLEEKNNHFMFLLNSAFLIYINAVLGLIFGVAGLILKFIAPYQIYTNIRSFSGPFYIGYDFINPYGYLLIGVLLPAFGYILYGIAVNVATEMGAYIRAGVDLYRLDLLRELKWELPQNLAQERDTWMALSSFFVAAERLNTPDFTRQYVYSQACESTASAKSSSGEKKESETSSEE